MIILDELSIDPSAIDASGPPGGTGGNGDVDGAGGGGGGGGGGSGLSVVYDWTLGSEFPRSSISNGGPGGNGGNGGGAVSGGNGGTGGFSGTLLVGQAIRALFNYTDRVAGTAALLRSRRTAGRGAGGVQSGGW